MLPVAGTALIHALYTKGLGRRDCREPYAILAPKQT